MFAQTMQTEAVCQLARAESVGEVLLISKNENDNVPELIRGEKVMQLLLCL